MNIISQKHFMEAQTYDSKGYIALMTVLIVGLIATSLTVSLLLLGTSQTKTTIALDESNRAKALTNACAEEALQQIRDSTAFAGSGALTFGTDTCTYTVIDLGGENRQITSTGNANAAVRKVKIIINDITPLILISSWQEVADF